MKPIKDYVHKRREWDNHRVILEVTDDDIISGIIAIVSLGILLGTMMGLAI